MEEDYYTGTEWGEDVNPAIMRSAESVQQNRKPVLETSVTGDL
jgi:hypothetical protein